MYKLIRSTTIAGLSAATALLMFSGVVAATESACLPMSDVSKMIDALSKESSRKPAKAVVKGSKALENAQGVCMYAVEMDGHRIQVVFAGKDFLVLGENQNLLKYSADGSFTVPSIDFAQGFMFLSPEEQKDLEGLVSFTVGKGAQSIFLITDPECPFCKQYIPELSKAVTDQYTVKVVLAPMVSHFRGEELTAKLYCEDDAKRKAFEKLDDYQAYSTSTGADVDAASAKSAMAALQSGTYQKSPYVPSAACEASKAHAAKVMDFTIAHKTTFSLPTTVFPDGFFAPGAMKLDDTKAKLELHGAKK